MAEDQHVYPRNFKFFRVLLLGFATKLAIPQRLVKCFIRENLRSVTLLSPLGKSWNVEIVGDNRSLHFADGWGRFAAAHRLRFGELLVFKYIGGMVFHVTVFDKSTCEKDYKITNGVAGVESVDHFPGQGENYDRESASSKEKTTPASSGQRTLAMEHESSHAQVSVRKAEQKVAHKAKKTTKQMYKRESRFMVTISAKRKYTVVPSSAINNNSKEVAKRKRELAGTGLRIPMKFARSNDLSSFQQMLLRNPEGHLWPVNLLHCKHPVLAQDWLLLSGGWRDFRNGNQLNDGDICIFELKKKNEMMVQIHRSCGDSSRTSKSLMPQAVHLKTETAALEQTGSSSKVTCTSKPADSAQFKSTIFPTNLRKVCSMEIPKAFLSLVDFSAEREVVLVDPHFRQWRVKICHDKRWGRCRMRRGWVDFCDENDVEVGDVCVFSFHRRGNEATFKVEVIKSKTACGKL